MFLRDLAASPGKLVAPVHGEPLVNAAVTESFPTRALWSAYAALVSPGQRRLPFRSAAAIERAQRRRVRRAVAHAYRNVPYYRETMDRLSLRPDEFRAAADLARLPLIERDQLQRDPEYFTSRARPIESYIKLRSSGTSGEPITVFHHPFSLFLGVGARARRQAAARSLGAPRFRARSVHIGSPTGSSSRIGSAFKSMVMLPPSLRAQRLNLSIFDAPARNVERINEFRPDLLYSYGSYLETLFLHVHSTGVDFFRPRVALYGADAVGDGARRLISDELGIPLLGAYGAIEAFHIGFECEQGGGFHLNTDLYPVRVIGASGEKLPDHQSGEVVVSNLLNRATVLLNYRLGDLASTLPPHCPCGRNLPRLSFIEGRVDDWLESRSGKSVHPQQVRALFNREEDALRYQVVQRSLSSIAVAVVAAADCNRERLRARLIERFVELFGSGTAIDVAFVDSLPRTNPGKVRTVITRRSEQGAAGGADAAAATWQLP